MIGEFFGATHDFEYNIGDKLYEFAIMSYEDFDKLKTIPTPLCLKNIYIFFRFQLKLLFTTLTKKSAT